MKRSFVLKANKESIILNWIRFNVWHGRDFSESLEKTIKHYREDNLNLELDINMQQAEEYIINYLKSLAEENNFNNFLKSIYETYCFKNVSFKRFVEQEELPFKSKIELYSFINNKLIPSF